MQVGKPWIQVNSGQARDTAFDYEHPERFEWPLHSIAWHLSQLNRFTGAARKTYSVAEHSRRVAVYAADLIHAYADPALGFPAIAALARKAARAGLMHDAVEAVIGDVNSPLKAMPFMKGFKDYEKTLHPMVAKRFDLEAVSITHDGKPYDVVLSADITALDFERAQLLGEPPGDWKRYDVLPVVESLAFQDLGWNAEFAFAAFLDHAELLGVQ